MDINKKIQLRQFESVNSVNEDSSIKVDLNYSNKLINENNINNVLDVTNQFDRERQNLDIYRIHGQLQILSILNGISTSYSTIEDFFRRPSGTLNKKNLENSFRFYILKPVPPAGSRLANDEISTGYESLGNNRFVRKFEVIKTDDDFNIQKAGFSTNIFGEQQFAFTVFGDVNVTNQFDAFNIPLTELFLYVEFDPRPNGNGESEGVRIREFSSTGGFSGYANPVTDFDRYEVGDIIEGDIVQLNANRYSQEVISQRTYRIEAQYENANGNDRNAVFEYNPFIPIRIRYLSDDLQSVSLDTTDYQRKIDIPDNAFNIGGDNFVWRDLLDKGFLDPLTEEGVNYPFINLRHYIFINQVLSFKSVYNLNIDLLSDTVFSGNNLIQTNPTSDLDKIGDKC